MPPKELYWTAMRYRNGSMWAEVSMFQVPRFSAVRAYLDPQSNDLRVQVYFRAENAQEIIALVIYYHQLALQQVHETGLHEYHEGQFVRTEWDRTG